jgi:hypothetical protein
MLCGVQDYFMSPTAGTAPAAAVAAAPRRGGRRLLVGSVLLLALVAVTVGVAGAAGRASSLPVLRQAQAPAPASVGWGPSWADDDGRPGRWDPCAPVRYVVNPTWAPQTGRADLVEALRRISAVSGLRFVDDGDTDETPSLDRPAYQPDRYGARWAPLLVTWAPPSSTDVGIGGGTKGVALTVAVPGEAGPSILSGQVVLDAEQRLPSGFGPGSTEGEVLLHELAHAVGLGHVDDPTQVMYYRTTNSDSEFGAGDRAGLTALGAAAGCLPAPRPQPVG